MNRGRSRMGESRSSASRAQSEVVGVALLVGVFATLAIIVGVVVIGNVTEQADDEPLADLNVTANSENITLTHSGGDNLNEADVTVVLRRQDTQRYQLSTFTEPSGDGDPQFEPAESRRHSHSFSPGQLRVFVVHEPSNTVLYDETIETG